MTYSQVRAMKCVFSQNGSYYLNHVFLDKLGVPTTPADKCQHTMCHLIHQKNNSSSTLPHIIVHPFPISYVVDILNDTHTICLHRAHHGALVQSHHRHTLALRDRSCFLAFPWSNYCIHGNHGGGYLELYPPYS